MKGLIQHRLLPFVAAVVFTVAMFLSLSFLNQSSYVYLFLFRSWYVQAVTTWLFMAAMTFVYLRFHRLHEEAQIMHRKVAVSRLDIITPEQAENLLQSIPQKYQDSLSFRRISELLRGYLLREEVVRLNQELSRRDVEHVETGHLMLNALRQLIPLLGFLGTIVGLSIGMVRFPEISQAGDTMESLRKVLREFAASMSVAFDTTLLALGYSVIVVLVSSVLRHREESFVTELDQLARQLIQRMRPQSGLADQGLEGADATLKAFLEELSRDLRSHNTAVVGKLEEVRLSMQKPPSYEITVQPVEVRGNG